MGKRRAGTTNSTQEKDQWLTILNPEIQDRLDGPPEQENDEEETGGGNGRAGLKRGRDALFGNGEEASPVREDALSDVLRGEVVRADSQTTPGLGSVKGGADVEVITKDIKPYSGKFGKISGSCTIKIGVSAGASGSGGFGADSKATLKDKKEGRTPGLKQTFSDKDIGDLELFKGLSFSNVDINVEGELSGTEVSVAGSFKFDITTAAFTAPASLKVTLVKVKLGDSIKVAAIELKVAPKEFSLKFHGVETKASAEFKLTFEVDWKKIGVEILERIAKKKLKDEAKKQGVKVLGREAAELVLKDLGPLAAAFSVGLDIGEFLNEYTVAPQVARAVDDLILGDLAERYHEADTLGKMWLLSKNSPRIVAALVASGVAGAVAGMGDLLLFKIMGLPGEKDFQEAYKLFSAGVHEMTKIVKMTRDNIEKAGPGSMVYGAIMLGIKTNPKHAICAHASLEPIIASIYAKLHTLYKPGGVDNILSLKVGQASIDQSALDKFSNHLLAFKSKYDGTIDLTNQKTVGDSLKAMLVSQLLVFLEKYNLIRYNVKIDGNLDSDEIDEKLLDELYAGTPLENVK